MNPDTPHPIQLDKVYFTKCSVMSIPEYMGSNEPIVSPPDNKLDVKKTGTSPNTYVASMQTKVNHGLDNDSPYFIDIECIGFFLTDDTVDEAQAIRGVTITAHSVLFGAIRETVAWLTSRQPFGTLMLGLSVLRNPQPSDSASTAKPE